MTKFTINDTAAMIAIIDQKIDMHKANLEEFKHRLDQNPVYAFEWGETALKASVAIAEYTELKHWLGHIDAQVNLGDRAIKMAEVLERYERDAHNAATRIPSSTAAMGNMVENHKRAILSSILGWLQGRFMGSLI